MPMRSKLFAHRVLRATLAVAAVAAMLQPSGAARAEGVLVTYEEAARHALERAWFAQVPLDYSRSRASTWYLHVDRLYCVTDTGLVTALNAETGAQLWTRQIGRHGVPAFGPEANSKYLGVVSGARLYLLELDTGRLKWSRELGSAPSSGPALSNDYAYVALVTGRIEGYRIDDPDLQPWYYQSKGRTFLRPTTTGNVVSWPTSAGYLYVSRAEDPGILFRLETQDDIVTSPAEADPYLYIASLDGYLYCMHQLTGREQWRFSTGYPIMSSPAIVANRAYVASIEPALHCLDATSGAALWSVAGVSHFGAQGKERVYASDRYGNLIILDAETGGLIGRLKTAEGIETMVNDQTDRIFLVNERGLVQCLREIGAETPTLHRQAAEPEGEQPTGEEADADPFEGPVAEPAAEADVSPFEGEDAEAAPDDQPEEEPAVDDNPFD
jgi:outer membrane protein assembly factor BamB